MLAVFNVVKHVFWSSSVYDRKLLPSDAALEKCPSTISDLSTMTGKERLEVFRQCGIDPILYPIFLRALQHITALHGSGSIEDGYIIHRHLSAHRWSYAASVAPLLGYPSVNSQPYHEPIGQSGHHAPTRAVRKAASGLGVGDVQYNGLLNQGATCYLNSLLQALFHLSAFRSVIYQMPTEEEAKESAEDVVEGKRSVPYALQRLFCMLQTAPHAVGTTELTESFGWSAADSFIQHDVHEMTRVLLDNLEEKLNAQKSATSGAGDASQGGTMTSVSGGRENAIHQLFNGSLESYVKVDEVGYYGAREEPFYDLQLVVKDTKDIYASFDNFFQVEVLDGKNKYCLEQNGTKTYYRAEKGVRLKETPPIMLLHLARFDYDVRQGETKVFTRWDYYSTLDLSRYMPHATAQDTHYTLCSVLVHSGSNTGFGHYFCFLRCAGAWYKFNDEIVTPASLKQVFGDNFGGYKVNYWGSEIPHTTNAYMLVYVRTSQMEHLLRPIAANDLPRHVMEQLMKEQEERERVEKERAEDHLYGRVHLIFPVELVEQEEFLSKRYPGNHRYPSHRMLRVLLASEALPQLNNCAARLFNGVAVDGAASASAPLTFMFWYVAAQENSPELRLGARVKSGDTVQNILGDESEGCVLVTTPATLPFIDPNEASPSVTENEYDIFHHKLYDPLQLKVSVLGSSVVRRAMNPQVALTMLEPHIRHWIAQLPDHLQKFHGHHLRPVSERGSVAAAPCTTESLPRVASELLLCKDYLAGTTTSMQPPPPTSGLPPGALHVLREDTQHHTYGPCDTLVSGDILVWQLETAAEDRAGVFYPNVASFQHFLRHRIPVEIKLNQAPSYPTLIDTELASDMNYEQLQMYVARLIGESANFDHIRFTRHNPDTGLPYFMKGRKKDRPTLLKLLTPATNRVTAVSKFLYYEYCKFTVTEVENAHSLQFKLYADNVKPVSSHWVLMSREVPITAMELFSICLDEIQRDYTTGAVIVTSPTRAQPPPGGGDDFAAQRTSDQFVDFVMHLTRDEAWNHLRLVDVWRSRIYNVLDRDHALIFEHQTFEESAEYRIERIPVPLPGVRLEDQTLIQVQHFTVVRQRKDPVETHSEPFSLYINHNELPSELLHRIADKLEMSYAAVLDWKLCLVRDSRVVEVRSDMIMGPQLRAFCDVECYQPNQREPTKVAFLGLEHAASAKRPTRREEKVVIFN